MIDATVVTGTFLAAIIGAFLLISLVPRKKIRVACDVVEASILGSRFYLLRGAETVKTVLGSSSLKTRRVKSDIETSKVLHMYQIGLVMNDHVPSWKLSRKLFAEGIGCPRFLKSLAPKLNAKMLSVSAKLHELAKLKKPILANHLLTAISADIMTNIVLSDSRSAAESYIEYAMKSSTAEGQEPPPVDDFIALMDEYSLGFLYFLKTPSQLYMNLPWMKKSFQINKLRVRQLQEYVKKRIKEMQGRMESEETNTNTRDLATSIYQSLAASSGDSDHAFKHTVACAKEALSKGHDTTRNTLAFLAFELARNPAVADAIHAEIAESGGENSADFSDESAKKMPLLHAAILEASRLYSLAVMVNRGLEEDLVVEGYTLKRGSQLLFALVWNHHDESVWQDPLVFNPYRFVDGKEASTGPVGFGYSLAPFGHGMRKCPGQSLAMMEIAVVIGHLVKDFKFHLVDPEMEVKVNEAGMVRECLDFAVQFVPR
ncbi:cytochrome P450 [Obelidium mucronatum]|nr:cytochrome P450 [Obelidium mucronatum]